MSGLRVRTVGNLVPWISIIGWAKSAWSNTLFQFFYIQFNYFGLVLHCWFSFLWLMRFEIQGGCW